MFESCTFETERLRVADWHAGAGDTWPPADLVETVAAILSPAVTRSLPAGWQGDYSPERTHAWMADRDGESTVLAVAEQTTGTTIGLMFISETGDADAMLGYLLAEHAWGRGFATELVQGFVGWCRRQPGRGILYAGVGPDNPASGRVLEKCGFEVFDPGEAEGEQGSGDRLYRLDLR